MDQGRSEVAQQALVGWLGSIAASGWRRANLPQAAELSGLPAEQITAQLGDKMNAVARFQQQLTEKVAVEASAAGPTAAVRERLFDGLMAGFDLLQAHRPAVQALYRSRDPGVAALCLALLPLSVRRIALAAGISCKGVKGRLRLAALSLLIGRAFRTWRQDKTADLSTTMAALDRYLDQAEQVAQNGLSADVIGLPGLASLRRLWPSKKKIAA